MNKKLFLYELKAIGKLPFFALVAYLVAWLGCGLFWAFGFLSLEAIDHISIVLLYAILIYTVVVAVYRTAAYDKLYAKMNKSPLALLGVRMLVVALIAVAATLLLLLGGTLMDVIARNIRPGNRPIYRYSARMFTCYRRSPYYILFPLSVAVDALVLYSAATVVVNAVLSVRHPAARIAAGLFSAVVMFLFVAACINFVSVFWDAPTWGMGGIFSYPMPFDDASYSVYLIRANASETVLCFRFYLCWNICNLFTLLAGCALIFFAFPACVFFRRKMLGGGLSAPREAKKTESRRAEN